ncbi:DUF6143 family protein [Romboutsia sp.]|uniref:DUF6143 family protein n=1 Tax=Romboutsia sp. TaxID=1965302 RepID=UPI003F3CC0E5
MSNLDSNLKKEVSIPYPLYQSNKGRYFIGQTPILTGQDQHALAALVNPITSRVNIYLNAITITNISALSLSAEFYVRSTFTGASISNLVSCVNLGFIPEPSPNGEILYLSSASQPPVGGIPIFSRIVSPYSTEVVDGSQIIISPGQSIAVYLGGYLPVAFDSAIVAFGWWEEKIINCHHYDY